MTTVLIADDSSLLREGLGAVLTLSGMSVIAKVGSAAGLRDALATTAPDVVIVGIPLAPLARDAQPSLVTSIRLERPAVGVLVLAARLDVRLALQLISRRPVSAGYMLKQPLPEIATLVRAVRVVTAGGTFVDRGVIERLRRERPGPVPLDGLSGREREILALMSVGRTNSAICDALCLNPKTIETHVRAIFKKLDLLPASDDHRRVLAVLRYLNSGDVVRGSAADCAAAA